MLFGIAISYKKPLTIISAPNDLTINIESISDELNIRKEDFSPLYTIKLTYSLYTNYESLESYILSNPCD